MTSIIEERNTVAIDGQSYKVRRLSVRDAFTLGRIVSVAMRETGEVMQPGMSQEVVGALLFASLPHCEDQINELFASLIAVTPEEFSDMPPDAPILIIEALADNSDIERFLRTCLRVWKADSTIRGLWRKVST